jgi:hypothetical protein
MFSKNERFSGMIESEEKAIRKLTCPSRVSPKLGNSSGFDFNH